MIVVVGHPQVAGDGPPYRPAGSAASAAMAASRRGAEVQLIGKVGDDDAGDALLVELARAGVGHAALLRDPARRTPRMVDQAPDDRVDVDLEAAPPAGVGPPDRPALEPADVDLGLRYFTEYRVVLAAEPLPEPIRRVVLDAARYAGAHLVLVTAAGEPPPSDASGTSIVLEEPEGGGGEAFAVLLGEVAASLDEGRAPADALAAAAATVGAVRPTG